MSEVPFPYGAPNGGPAPGPPKRRWARIGYWLFFRAYPYVLITLVALIPIGVIDVEVRWRWKWVATGVGAAMALGLIALVLWRRRKSWNGALRLRRAAKACPACGYDLIDVVHPPTSPGIPGQTARCPECGRGVRYIEPDPEMEELARAHSRRNDAATANAVSPSRTDINNAISGGEDASV